MRHPKKFLTRCVRERISRLLNSFMAFSMLLNTFSPVFFLGDIAVYELKARRYRAAERLEKATVPAFGLESEDGGETPGTGASPGVAFGTGLLPGWMADVNAEPHPSSSLVPTRGEDPGEGEPSGTQILPAWWASVPNTNQTWSASIASEVVAKGSGTNEVKVFGFCDSRCLYSRGADIAYVTLLAAFTKLPTVQTDTIGASVVFTFTADLTDTNGIYEGITITDTLPTGLGYVDAQLTYTEDGDGNAGGPTVVSGVAPTISPTLYSSGNVIWQLGDVSGTVQISGVITAVIQNILATNHGDRLVNDLEMTYVLGGLSYVFTDTAFVDIVEPTLAIEKDVTPTDAKAGQTVYYTITLYHAPSPSPVVSAYNVAITDVVPSGLSYLLGSLTQVSGPAADAISDTGDPTLTASWSEVPISVTQASPIRLRYAAVVDSNAPAGALYTNLVTTTWTSLPNNPYGETRDGDGGHGGADDYIDSDSAQVALSEVWLDKIAPLTVTAGTNITYTIYVFNEGPLTATSAIVTDTMPFQASTVSAVYAVPGGASGNCTITSGTPDVVVCSLGDIAADVTGTITIVALVDADALVGANLTNEAVLSVASADGDNANNQASTDTTIFGKADLGLVKTAPASVVAGETIAYTLVITNNGPSTARSVDVKDLLPDGLSFASASATQGFCVPGVCQLGDVTTGDVITIVITATVGSDVLGTITNEARVFADTEDPNATNDSDSASTAVTTSADLSVAKVDMSDPAAPLSTLIYEVLVTNDGPSDARNVVVTDTLDSNVTFVNASPGCTESGGVVNCTLSTLAAGDTVDYLISVKVGDVASGTVLTNVSVVGSETSDPDNANNTESITTTVEQDLGPSADLGITKSGTPATVVAGEYVTYTLTITNDGPAIATNVRVLELLPVGTTVQSISVTNPDYVGEYCSNGGSCYLGTVFTDTTAMVVVVLQVDDDFSASTLDNTASVAGDQQDPEPSDNIASETTNVTASVDLVIAKNDLMDPVLAGENILYQITVTNTGSSAAENVVITDSVPLSTTFVGASPLCLASGGVVSCQIGDLGAGERASVFVQVETDERLTDGSVVTNTVVVSSDTAETDATDNNDSEPTTVNQSSLNPTDLEIVKGDAPDPVLAGENLTYTLVVTNNGPAPAEDVLLVDALPDGVTFVSAESSQGLCNSGVTCDLGSLAVGASATVTIVVAVDAGQTTDLLNVARVSSSNPESDETNNEASEQTTVDEVADLEVLKSGSATATPGSTIAYQITVSNNGPSDAQDVDIVDSLPVELNGATASSSQGSCAIGANLVLCSLGTIAAGASATIDINASVDTDATGDIVNSVVAESPTDPTNPIIDAADTFTTTLQPIADLVLEKGASATVIAGETITYQLNVYNVGPSDAQGVYITDTLPVSVTFSSASSDCAHSAGLVVCGPRTVGAGSQQTLTITVMVDSDVVPGTSLENTAVVGAATADTNSANNDANADTSVTARADLGLRKTGPAAITAGESLTYTVVLTNAGPSTARDVDIHDLLPAGFTLESASTTQGLCVGAICQLGDVLAGDAITVTVVASVDSGASSGVYTNTVQVFSDTPDENPANDIDTTSTVVDTAALLRVSKIDLVDPVDIGGDLMYQISIENQGPSDAANVILTDTLPAGVAYQSDTAGCVHTAGVLSCALGTLTAGDTDNFLVTVAVSDSIVSGTVLSNAVLLTTTTPVVAGSALTDTEDTTAVQNLGIPTDLQIDKLAPTTVIAGEQLTYTLVVTNAGPAIATNVQLVDALPSGVDFLSASASNGGLCNAGVYCDLGTLANQEVVTITVVVDVGEDQAGNTLHNVALVNADQPDDTPDNAVDTADTAVTGLADIYIQKTASETTVPAGESLMYTLLVGNRGPSNAEDVTVSDTLPADFVLESVVSSQGSCSSLPCVLGTIAVDGSATITLIGTVSADAVGDLVNTASVTSTTPLTNTVDDVAVVTTTVETVADLSITKDVNTALISAGELLTYTLTVQNHGPSAAANVQASDLLPSAVTFVTTTLSHSGPNPLVWDLGILNAGETITWLLVVQALPTLADGYLIRNPATVTSDAIDPDSTNNEDEAWTQSFRLADVTVTKTTVSSTVVAGEAVTFTIDVRNNGPSVASNVEIKDVLPSGLTLQSMESPQGVCVNGICQLGTMQVNATAVITVVATVDSDAAEGALLCNQAVYFGDTQDPDSGNDSDDACITVATRADLSILKVGPVQPVIPGESMDYILTIQNNGPSDAQNVVVSDNLPAEVSFVSAVPAQSSGPNPLTWSLGTLAAGASQEISVRVAVEEWVTQTFTNTATVNASTTDPNSGDNSDSEPTEVTPQADLELIKTAEATVIAGDTITYTLTVYNHGPSDAENVVVTDTLPLSVTFLSASSGCGASPGVVVCGGQSLGASAFTVFTITVASDGDIPHGTSLENNAVVASSTTDPNPVNNAAVADTSVLQQADLSVTKGHTPEPVTAGETLTYTLTVHNAGPGEAKDVRVVDTLPGDVTYVDATPTPNSFPSPLIWLVDSMAIGETRVFTVVVTVNSDVIGTITNTLSAFSLSTPDPTPEDNTIDDPTSVETLADLSLNKSVTPDPVVYAGNRLTYTLDVYNAGPSDARNVMVTDTLPAEVTYLNTSLPLASGPNPLVWDLGTVPAGETRTIQVEVQVDPDVTGYIFNFADVGSSTPDPNSANNDDVEASEVQGRADLSVEKTSAPNPVVGGDTVKYTLVVHNAGPSDAVNVNLTDTLPAGVVFITASPAQDSGPNPLTWSLGTLVSGETQTVTVYVDVDVNTIGVLENVAQVGSSTVDPNPADNQVTEETPVEGIADLSVVKVDNTDPVAIEEVLTYLITVTNNGPNAAVNVVITDTLPPDVTYIQATPVPDSAPYPIVWNLGNMLVGEVKTITLQVYVEPWASAVFTNSVQAGAATADPVPGNLVASEPTAVGEPTAVTVFGFDGVHLNDLNVALQWELAAGVNLYGFKLYRASENDFASAEVVQFVSASGAGEYRVEDTVPQTGEWWYWLTQVSTSGGESSPLGPVIVAVEYLAYLPLVLR